MIKRILFLISFLSGCMAAHAQHEITGDSLTLATPDHEPSNMPLMPETKNYGGFLLDMSLLNVQAPPRLTDFKLEYPDLSKDYSRLFRLDPHITFSQGTSTLFASPSAFWSSGSLSPWGWGSNPTTWQMSSFKLKNGMRLNTYGQYNSSGRKVYNPSALPWERNDFKGAFELKSANGAFGVRIEVQQNR